MSKVEMKSRLEYLESILPLVEQNERDAKGIPLFRVPMSAMIKREIQTLRLKLAE